MVKNSLYEQLFAYFLHKSCWKLLIIVQTCSIIHSGNSMLNEKQAVISNLQSKASDDIIEVAQQVTDLVNCASDLLNDVKDHLSKGRKWKIRLKLGNKVIADLPVALTLAGALAAVAAAIIVTKLSVDINQDE